MPNSVDQTEEDHMVLIERRLREEADDNARNENALVSPAHDVPSQEAVNSPEVVHNSPIRVIRDPLLPKAKTKRIHTVSATRVPHHILVTIFEYLNLKDVKHCLVVCKHWNAVLGFEKKKIQDSKVWRSFAQRKIPEVALADPYLLSELSTWKKRLRAFFYAWNPRDVSKNNYVRTNGFTVHRQPVAQSTDGVRGKIGISKGIHAFDLTWEGPLGTVAVLGVATRHAALHCPGYVALLGSDDQSWGWNLVDNALVHNGEQMGTYPRFNNPPKYQVGERIRMVVDCDRHVVYFEKAQEFLGMAFVDIPPVKLYPAACAVYGNTEVSMVYLGPPLMG